MAWALLAAEVHRVVQPPGPMVWGICDPVTYASMCKRLFNEPETLSFVMYIFRALEFFSEWADVPPAYRGDAHPIFIRPRSGPHPRSLALLARPSVTALTPEWMEARQGCVTASSWPRLFPRGQTSTSLWVTDSTMFRNGTGTPPAPFTGSEATRYGQAMEKVAIAQVERTCHSFVMSVGFLRRGAAGATPDGILLDEPTLVEIKCPWSKRNVTALRDYYTSQMQCQMFVADIPQTLFAVLFPDPLRLFTSRVTIDRWWLHRMALPIVTEAVRRMTQLKAAGDPTAVMAATGTPRIVGGKRRRLLR